VNYFIVSSIQQLYVLSFLCLHEQLVYLLISDYLLILWCGSKQVVSIPLGEALLALIFGCFVYILFISCISGYIDVSLYLSCISCLYLVHLCI
jgi:hypothetical protein